MIPTASLDIEEFTIGNRTFYKTTYFDIILIRTSDNFYNATKICQDNGISDFRQISRFKFWKDYVSIIKEYGIYNHETSKICPDFNLLKEEHTADSQSVPNSQISDDLIMFTMDRQSNDKSWISGTYIHEILLNKLLMHIDNKYAFRVSHLLNMINEELHLRNITLEQKISEQKQLIDKLQEQLETLKKPEVNSVVEKGQYKFERTDYNGISVLREVTTGYYNASKMCRDNGKLPKDIFERDYWKEYVQEIKSVISWGKIPSADLTFDLIDHSDNNFRGIYIHPKLVNFLCMRLNVKYAVKVSEIMDMINEELHLRNITLDQKITETEAALNKLRDLHERSGRGMNHDKAGCILLKPSIFLQNTYKIWYDEIEHLIPEEHGIITINEIYNPKDTARELNFYSKNKCFEKIKWNGDYLIQFDNVDDVKEAIKQIQTFNVRSLSIDECIDLCKESYSYGSINFISHMFEIYCAERFNYKLYKFDKTESLSLTKIDKGLDLLDINERRMGQCKFYQKSTLSMELLKSFRNFCMNYPTYEHILYVNEDAKFAKGFHDDLFRIECISTSEFLDWYNKKTQDLIKNGSRDSRIRQAREWLTDQLKTHEYLLYDDVQEHMNIKYNLQIFTSKSFNEIFGDLYIHKPNEGLPKLDGKRILKTTKTINESEKCFLIEFIHYGYYLKEEVTNAFNEHFGTDVSNRYITQTFHELWKQDDKSRKQRRNYNHQCVEVLELNDEFVPNRDAEFKTFIESLNGNEFEFIINSFNNEFHRQETKTSIQILLEKLDINLECREKQKETIKKEPNKQRKPKLLTWKCSDKNINSAKEWLKTELLNNVVKYDYALEYINTNFDLKIETIIMFGKLFSELYNLDSKNNEKVLVRRLTLEESANLKSREREFIIKFIGYGEFLKEELVIAINNELGTNYENFATIGRNHHDLFKYENKTHMHRRRINGHNIEILELDDTVLPEKINALRSFAATSTRDEFNTHFHRFESALTFTKLRQ